MPEVSGRMENLMIDAKGFGKDFADKKRGFSKRTVWYLIAAAVLFAIGSIAGVFFEYIEILEVGEKYTSVFFKNIVARILVQGTSFVLFFVCIFLSILFLRRNLSVMNVERAIFEKLTISALIGIVFAFILSRTLGSSLWEKLLIFTNGGTFSKTDPVFGKDIGYYVFQRPFLESALNSILGAWLAITVFVLAAYWILGTVAGGYSFSEFFGIKRIAIHNLVNIAVLVFLYCLTYIFKAEEILYGSFGELFGAGYTDKTIWLSFYKAAPFIIVLLTVLSFIFIFNKRYKAAIAAALVFPASVIATAVLAFLVQSVFVAPNEVIKEQENISANIEFTQAAYGLDNISEVVFDVKNDLAAEELKNHSEVTDNIRILDLSANLTVLNQIQGIRNYYKFVETDIVPYTINGKKTAVAITPREITKENLSDSADTYINNTLRYTHGFGVVANAINTVTSQGQPEFLIKDIPPKSAEGLPEIKQPRIYYGEITDDYVVVGNEKYKELDYSENQEDIEFSYDGSGGVRLSPLNRLVFAIKYGDVRLVLSDLVSSKSRILINRNIAERLEIVAPFLKYDADPYMIIDGDGALKWIVDAYTFTDKYPYSQSTGEYNYIRNSIKAVIDAYNGDVKLYVVDKTDPIANMYKSLYPEIFENEDLPGDLKKHIKYPEYLFDVQARVYGKYHLSNPTVFYNKNDMWAIAKERYGTATEEKELVPYYNMVRLEDADEEELLLTIPYTLANKDNMVAWLAVSNEWNNYGKLQVYKFPKDINIYGPMQVENRINSDMEISKALNLWSQGGSQVIRGNMIVVPIGKSILYVEPIYIASSNKTTLPELKQVVVAYDEKIVMKANLQEALYALFGESAPQRPETSVLDEPENYESVASRVIAEFDKVKKASSENDWNAFGNSLKSLEGSIEELRKSINNQE